MDDVTIVEKNFGMLWSLLTIAVAIAIGCAVVVYIEGHTGISYKLESGLQELEQKLSASVKRSQDPHPVATVKDAIPSNYTMVLQ